MDAAERTAVERMAALPPELREIPDDPVFVREPKHTRRVVLFCAFLAATVAVIVAGFATAPGEDPDDVADFVARRDNGTL